MPELLGICGRERLSPDQLAGWSRLVDAVCEAGSCKVDSRELSCGAIAVVTRFDRDQGELAQINSNNGAPARIGRVCSVGISEDASTADSLPDDLPPPYALVRLDDDGRSCRMINDPFGFAPIYYADVRGTLIFGTDAQALLRSGLFDWELDRRAVLDFLTFEHVLGDRTFADALRVLPPGAQMRYDNGRIDLKWQSPVDETDTREELSLDDVADGLHEHLSRSVARALDGAGRVAITLSGGWDSRALLGLAVRNGADVRAFTFGREGSRDLTYARQLAKRCGVPHTGVSIDGGYLRRWLEHGVRVTGGMVSCNHYHIAHLAEQLASQADVVLDGLGGDALTGGHLTRAMVRAADEYEAMAVLVAQRATAFDAGTDRETVLDREFLAGLNHIPTESLRVHFESCNQPGPWRGCHRFDMLERQRRFIQFGPHQLRPLIDVQTPFYDPGLVKLMLSSPLRWLENRRAYRRMHVRYLTDLAEVPDSDRGMALTWSEKARFGKRVFDAACRRCPGPIARWTGATRSMPTDYANWYRNDLRDLVRERLLDSGNAGDDVLNRTAVETIVTEHLEGIADHTAKIGCLLTFVSWRHAVRRSIQLTRSLTSGAKQA